MSQDVFKCPGCGKEVYTSQMEAHFKPDEKGTVPHNVGLYVATPPPQLPPQQAPPDWPNYAPYPYPPQQQQKPRNRRDAPPLTQTWPHGNLPQRPATRDLVWYQQILGMWYYYRKGMAYFGVIVMMASLIFLTEPWRFFH